MPWDDLIEVTNKAKARAKIQGSIHLDQRCLKGKWPLKMSLNFKNDQTDKKVLQAKEKANSQTKQEIKKLERSEKTEKARKEKRKNQKERQGQREGSTPASRINTTLAEKKNGQNHSRPRQDLSQMTCYNCNKHDYYVYNCPELKK